MRVYVRLFILLISLSLLVTCSNKHDEAFILYRFVDRLERKNITASPYLSLEKELQKIKQQWPPGHELRPLSIDGRDYHSLTTQRPVMAWETDRESELLSITCKGKNIPHAKESEQNVLNWDFQKTKYDFDQFLQEKQKVDVFTLDGEEILEQKLLLAEGKFLIHVWAESKNPRMQHPYLRIELNGQLIGMIIIGPYKRYILAGQARLGWNTIAFSYEKKENQKSQNEQAIFIDKTSTKSLKDLILISIPEGEKSFYSEDFSAQYIPEPAERIYRIGKKISDSQRHGQEIHFDSKKKYAIAIIGHSPAKDSILSVFLDGKQIFKGSVSSRHQNIYLVETLSAKGKHILEVLFQSFQPTKESFFLSDVIVKDSTMDSSLYLARMKHKSPIPNIPSEINPFNLKKKRITLNYMKNMKKRIADDTMNVLLAPPYSKFQFELRIPPSAELDFGYGIENVFSKELGREINFKVVIEEKGREEILFSRDLMPYKRKFLGKALWKTISLSDFSNKKVKVKFITSFVSSSLNQKITKDKIPNDVEFAFWENPVIYRLAPKDTPDKQKPNIILISLDTLRADHLKCYGYGRETSPNMDILGEDGVIFRNAFSSTSWTLPAHMSLLTALDNRNHRVDKANPHLDSSIPTLADLLRKKGYSTSAITGGALVSQRFGFSKGFDFYREFKFSRRSSVSAKTLFNHFENWIVRNKHKNFLLFLHTYQTHAPYSCPAPFNSLFFPHSEMPWEAAHMDDILFGIGAEKTGPYRDLSPLERENIVALYDGEIRYTDEVLIKPLIQKLKELKLYQNTMIILTSDHGEEFYEHKAWTHGHTLYKELIHIPLIIKFPHSKHKNSGIYKTVRIVDIMPTILDEVGIDISQYNFDGVSLINYLQAGDHEEQIALADLDSLDNPHRLPIKISMDWNGFKFILNNDHGKPPEHYLPVPPPIAQVELYDKNNDPYERYNIAEQNKDIVREFIDKIYQAFESSAEWGKKKRKGIDKELEETMRALGYIR